MTTVATGSKKLVQDYLEALSGKPKTEGILNQYVSDPSLKEHIYQAEAAFPLYELIAHQVIAEDDLVAVRATFDGTHLGDFAGIPGTGRRVSSPLMIIYRIVDGRIAEHWMYLDFHGIVEQLRK